MLGNDADGSFQLQIDMFLQMKIAIIVATRYVFWAAGMPKMLSRGLSPTPRWRANSASPDPLAAVCRYIKQCCLTTKSWKMLLGVQKIQDNYWIFCIQ